MKVIVPGGSGFIGKNFVLNAPRNWEIIALYNKSKDFVDFVNLHGLNNVIPVQCDLTKEDDVKSFFDKYGDDFDVCIYLVANLSIPLSVKKPSFDLALNTSALLNFLTHFRGKKFIFFSSGAVYDGLEGFVSPASKVNPKIPYAISKLASEQYVKFYQYREKTFDEYIILRFFGAYGPYEASRKIYTKLIKAFHFENKNEFTLYGTGRNYIDAMYIDDAVNGIIKVIKGDEMNLTIDFCYGTPYTINELVWEAAKIFNKSEIILKHEGETEEYIKFYSSYEPMKKLFDFAPTTSLKDGLLKFAKLLELDRGVR